MKTPTRPKTQARRTWMMVFGVISMWFFCNAGLLLSQELPFTHYTPENEVNPLPSADVRSIYQDRLGYMWMVVYSSGLLRYNGHQFIRYTTDDGLPGLDVREVVEDTFGKLWVGTDEGLVVSDRPLAEYEGANRIHFSSKIGSRDLVQTSIIEHRIVRDSAGIVWVGTRENGILRYHLISADSAVVDTVKTDIHHEGKNRDVRCIIVRRNGSVCVSLAGGELLTFTGESGYHKVLDESNRLPKYNSDVLFENGFQTLFGGCQNGLVWELDERGKQPAAEIVGNELKSRITSINELLPGLLWFGSEGSGILEIGASADTTGSSLHGALQRAVYTKRNGLLSDNISSIFKDRESNVWVTQVGGISKLRSNYRAFLNYTATSHGGVKPNLPNSSVNVLIPPSQVTPGLWVGTSGGGVTLIAHDGTTENIQVDQGLRSDWVNGLAFDGKKRLWIGTTSGINCLALDTRYPPPPSANTRTIHLAGTEALLAQFENTTIYACKVIQLPTSETATRSVESVWLLGYQHLYCFVEGKWFIFRTHAGLPATFFDVITLDPKGIMWIGTRDAGLYRTAFPLSYAKIQELGSVDFSSHLSGVRFGKEIVTPVFEPAWTESMGAPSNQIETMAWNDSTLWVGTPEGLMALTVNPLRIRCQLSKSHGLIGNDVTSLAFSPVTGSLWIGTNGGLAEIDPKAQKVIRTITKQDGLVDNEVWFYGSVAVGGDGSVYFGTSKGLTLYSPQFDKANTLPPIARLEMTSIRESSVGDNEITFEYAALSFANEKLVRYKTRLVGYDKDWSAEKSDVNIRYTNLPAFLYSRVYTFEVVASNNYGVWTPTPLRFSFSIQPPWWFRWWWLGLNLAILIVLVYAYSKHRLKRLEQRSRELEKIVEERTHEIKLKAEKISSQAEQLSHKNQELELKNQEIVKTQEQLIMQEKLASLGALTAGIAHEIKNPLNFVNNFAELSIELARDLRQDLGGLKDHFDPKMVTRIEETISDLEHNSAKINEHGKRADSIVRGMLLHSRGKSGEHMPTDINVLLDEYVILAYHGLRAQDPSFNITIQTDYDKSIEQLDVVPQDLSRVFLNIVNNACYAVNERKKSAGSSYSPVLSVRTKNLGDKAEVRIRDNGTGIPKELVDKIFDPFFTTKPTGKGTGLGLSLSYDIIVKQHGGELKVETEFGSYTELIIRLPKKTK